MSDNFKKILLVVLYLVFFGMLIYRGDYFDRLKAMFQMENNRIEGGNNLLYTNTVQGWSLKYPDYLEVKEKIKGKLTSLSFVDGKGDLKILLERYDSTQDETSNCLRMAVYQALIDRWLSNCGASPRDLTLVGTFTVKDRSLAELNGSSLLYDHLQAYTWQAEKEVIYAIFPIPVKQDIYAADGVKEEAKRILESVTEQLSN